MTREPPGVRHKRLGRLGAYVHGANGNGGEPSVTDGDAAGPEDRTVSVRVVGGGAREVTLEAEATCADLLRAVDLSPHTATVLVDGRPVPSDARVPADEVRVLRLVKGG